MSDFIVESKKIVEIFSLLNKSEVKYILMRNINNELPSTLRIGKDIDILVRKEDEKKIDNFFNSNKYKTVKHPLRRDVFLYGVDKFAFKFNEESNIYFDLNFQILVRSLDLGQWIPLEQDIQRSAWENRRFEQITKEFGYWTLSYEDECVCLIARSVFDKKEFQIGYINRIQELFKFINEDAVIEKLNKIFFKFTPILIKYIKNDKYGDIIDKYLKFKEY